MESFDIRLIVGLILGILVGYGTRYFLSLRKSNSIEQRAEKLEAKANQKAQEIILIARQDAVKSLDKVRDEEKDLRLQLKRFEERLSNKEEELVKTEQGLREKEKSIKEELSQIDKAKEDLKKNKDAQIELLEKISKLSKEKAKDILLKEIEKEYQNEIYGKIKALEEQGEFEMEEKAKTMMSLAMQRLASTHSSEITSYTFDLPSDDLKGKIIGKEGRNIRAFERASGVEIIVDETPGIIILSSFNPIRREIARVAMERLIKDGRIQPARIEEEIEKARVSVSEDIIKAGKDAVYKLGIVGLSPDLVKIIGRLKFRTSYGQNVLEHSMETAQIAEIIATELRANIGVAKRGGLLHDIGKAVDREVQGTHVEIGRRILDKYEVPREVIQAMESHHGEYPAETVEALIVEASDAISASRVGARKTSLEEYLQRLGELEEIANDEKGVEKSYAIQAGRELRVFVNPKEVSDINTKKLAHDIARKIEKKLQYPGDIKVIVIRENRIIEYAK